MSKKHRKRFPSFRIMTLLTFQYIDIDTLIYHISCIISCINVSCTLIHSVHRLFSTFSTKLIEGGLPLGLKH